jgi:hypothetical protein
MRFERTAPSVVKAIRQRDLLNTWLRLYHRSRSIPSLHEYEPNRLKEEASDLVYYQVDATKTPPGFVIQSEGTRMAKAYGKTGMGRELEEYVGTRLAPVILPAYRICFARQSPVYTVDDLEDAGGHEIQYERLLLPFGSFGRVSNILASLKAISIDGSFAIQDLMKRSDALPRAKIRTVIDCKAADQVLKRSCLPDDLIFE